MQHSGLENGRWAQMPFIEQMANIGSEVSRTTKWLSKGNAAYAEKAFERALELIDLTIRYGRTSEDSAPDYRYSMLREVCRVRELFCEAYLSADIPSLNSFDDYFMHFAIAHRTKTLVRTS